MGCAGSCAKGQTRVNTCLNALLVSFQKKRALGWFRNENQNRTDKTKRKLFVSGQILSREGIYKICIQMCGTDGMGINK